MRALAFAVCALLGVIAWAVWLAPGSLLQAVAVEASGAEELERDPALLADAPQAGRTAVAAEMAQATPAGAPADEVDDSLRELLRAVALAERAQDGPPLEAALRPVIDPELGSVGGVERVLDGLIARAWTDDALALRGADISLCVAAVRELAHGGTAHTAAILAALPLLPTDQRETLVGALAETRAGERPLIGAAWLARVLALARAHPDLAGELAVLFEHLDEDLEGLAAARADLESALAAYDVPPIAVAALRGLWALDPAAAELATAELARHVTLDVELRAQLAQGAALRAPPERALDLLAAEKGIAARAGLQALGTRPEAREALRMRYSDLVASGQGERERVGLVSAMHQEDSLVLLGIAETDPSRDVREQALLTLTSSRAVDAGAVALMRSAFVAPAGGVRAGACVAAAGNVVVLSQGAARDEALGLLREIARSPTCDRADRAAAIAILRRHDPDDAWAEDP